MKNQTKTTKVPETSEVKEKQPQSSDFSIDISQSEYETENEPIVKPKRTRKTKVIKKEFPIPLSSLAKILATLPFTLVKKWITSFPKLTPEEEKALEKAWCDYLEYALEPDTITPAYSLLTCYALLLSSRAIVIGPEVVAKIKKAKKVVHEETGKSE